MNEKSQDVDIRHIANLARLNLNDGEISRYETDINAILSYAEQLSKVDLSDVSPTAHAASITNVIRSDEERGSMTRSELLDNAPDVLDDELIKVPVVIRHGSEGPA